MSQVMCLNYECEITNILYEIAYVLFYACPSKENVQTSTFEIICVVQSLFSRVKQQNNANYNVF